MVICKGKYEKIESFLNHFYEDMASINEVVSEFLRNSSEIKVDELKEEIASFLTESSYTDEDKIAYMKAFMSFKFAEDQGIYLNWLKLEGDKMPAINSDLADADYQELGAERGLLHVEIESLKQELLYKQKRLSGVVSELERRDQSEGVDECCTKCGKFAGFETSPEGDNCGICNEWICSDCTDSSVSQLELVLPNGRLIAEDVICKMCSDLLGLHELHPVEIPIKVSRELALLEHIAAVDAQKISIGGYVYVKIRDIRDRSMESRGVKGFNCASFRNEHKKHTVHIYHVKDEVFTVESE